MLRLVHPAPSGQGSDPSHTRRKGKRAPSLFLTPEETRHLAAALQNLRRAYGSWGALAEAMGVRSGTVASAGAPRVRRASGMLAIRAARAGGVSVEAVLGGGLTDAGRCSACGARVGTRAARAPAGSSEEPRPWPTGGGVA